MFRRATNENSALTHDRPIDTPKSLGLQPSSEDGVLEYGENAIELENFPLTTSKHRPVNDDRQRRRDQKKERKLQSIREREEMKFSHSIQFNAVPDWSSHYISYSNLKKL